LLFLAAAGTGISDPAVAGKSSPSQDTGTLTVTDAAANVPGASISASADALPTTVSPSGSEPVVFPAASVPEPGPLLPPAAGSPEPGNTGAATTTPAASATPTATAPAPSPLTDSAGSPATPLPGADGDGLLVGDPAPLDDPFWRVLEKRLLATLGSITPEVSTLHVNMEVSAGPVFLGSGTLAVKKPGFVHLELFSRQASCRYQNRLGTSSCFLAHPGRMIAFKTGGDAQVPVPLIKIEREPTQGFRFDFNMLISPGTASQPIQFGVHPDTGPYLAKRIREKFPRVRLASSTAAFFAPGNATPSVILEWVGTTISSGTAWFDRDGNVPPIKLFISELRVNAPLPDPTPAEIIGESYQPSGSVDTIYTFVDGFYKLMSDFMPRENE
jgi:hypothetical protein